MKGGMKIDACLSAFGFDEVTDGPGLDPMDERG